MFQWNNNQRTATKLEHRTDSTSTGCLATGKPSPPFSFPNPNPKTNLKSKTNPILIYRTLEKKLLILFFAFLAYIGIEKCKKNKSNTDPNPTTNPYLKATIDTAAKRKKLNKVP